LSDLDNLTRNIGIPAWMVWGAIALFAAVVLPLAGTIGGVIVVDRNQMHQNTAEIGYLRERVGRNEEKTRDILDAINGMRREVQEIARRMP
jgi:hypothetical protein